MKPLSQSDMLKATQLTREGRLGEATRLIQQLLTRGHSDSIVEPHTTRPSSIRAPIIIEGTAERIEEAKRGDLPPEHRKKPSPGVFATEQAAVTAPKPAHSTGSQRSALGRLGNAARKRHAPKPPVAPAGAQFLSRRFTGAAGSRDYKLYIPSCYRGEALPLVVMLHGCTQSADDFATGTRMNDIAEEHGLLVAYPMQSKSANPSRCWNWFKPGDQRRDSGEPSLIAGITSEITCNFRVDSGRIFIAGLSAGGAAAAIMGAAYPDIYAAIGVHSGLPAGVASDLPSAFAAMRQGSSSPSKIINPRTVPAIVFHGDQDTTVHPSNGAHIIEQIRAGQVEQPRVVTASGTSAGGRTFTREQHLNAKDRTVMEMWVVHGAGHAWSGGSPDGSYTDPYGPDASRAMVDFFINATNPRE